MLCEQGLAQRSSPVQPTAIPGCSRERLGAEREQMQNVHPGGTSRVDLVAGEKLQRVGCKLLTAPPLIKRVGSVVCLPPVCLIGLFLPKLVGLIPG